MMSNEFLKKLLTCLHSRDRIFGSIECKYCPSVCDWTILTALLTAV